MVGRAADWSFYIHESGRGRPVVLLHGLLTNSSIWRPLATRLQDAYRVFAVDAPGHGSSPVRPAPFTLEEEVAALAETLNIRLAGEQAVWIGHSMGGMKVMRLALDHSALVRALVLVSTQPYAEAANARQTYEAMVESIKLFGMSDDLADVIAKMNFHPTFRDSSSGAQWIEHFRTLRSEEIEQPSLSVYRREDISPRLSEIKAPTLVVHGVNDVPIRLRVARSYAALLPDARLVELPDTGHTPPTERPDEFGQVVRDFLDSLDPAEGDSE